MKVAEIFLYLAWHGFILTLIFGKKRVAKIQEQIVIAEEIMGNTQLCVPYNFFKPLRLPSHCAPSSGLQMSKIWFPFLSVTRDIMHLTFLPLLFVVYSYVVLPGWNSSSSILPSSQVRVDTFFCSSKRTFGQVKNILSWLNSFWLYNWYWTMDIGAKLAVSFDL